MSIKCKRADDFFGFFENFPGETGPKPTMSATPQFSISNDFDPRISATNGSRPHRLDQSGILAEAMRRILLGGRRDPGWCEAYIGPSQLLSDPRLGDPDDHEMNDRRLSPIPRGKG